MLEANGDFLVKPSHMRMEGEPVDSTDKDTIIWELVVPTEAGLDTQCHSPPLSSDGPSWDMDFEPMTLPVEVQWLVRSDLYCCPSNNVSSSDDWEGLGNIENDSTANETTSISNCNL